MSYVPAGIVQLEHTVTRDVAVVRDGLVKDRTFASVLEEWAIVLTEGCALQNVLPLSSWVCFILLVY